MRSLPRAALRHYSLPVALPLPLPPTSSLPPVLRLLHTHLTVLFIDDSSLPFLSGHTFNTGTLVPRGPNGLISTVWLCPFSRMTHKGTKKPLCVCARAFPTLVNGTHRHARCFSSKDNTLSSLETFKAASFTGSTLAPHLLTARTFYSLRPPIHPFVFSFHIRLFDTEVVHYYCSNALDEQDK